MFKLFVSDSMYHVVSWTVCIIINMQKYCKFTYTTIYLLPNAVSFMIITVTDCTYMVNTFNSNMHMQNLFFYLHYYEKYIKWYFASTNRFFFIKIITIKILKQLTSPQRHYYDPLYDCGKQNYFHIETSC